jgi:hypothetical protein
MDYSRQAQIVDLSPLITTFYEEMRKHIQDIKIMSLLADVKIKYLRREDLQMDENGEWVDKDNIGERQKIEWEKRMELQGMIP